MSMYNLCDVADTRAVVAIRLALRELDYPTFYKWDVMGRAPGGRDVRLWTELLDRKFNTTAPVTKSDLDIMLSDYSACADLPCICFPEELLKAYPQAKVILSVRDNVDVWYNSFRDTIWRYQQQMFYPEGFVQRFWAYMRPPNSYTKMLTLINSNTPLGSFPTQGKQWYFDHNQRIRDLVPSERLLEFNPKEGWEPLCRFLGKEVPESVFPRSNESAGFTKGIDREFLVFKLRRYRVLLRRFSVLMVLSAVILSVLSVWSQVLM
jgi:Sulfotransferase domain